MTSGIYTPADDGGPAFPQSDLDPAAAGASYDGLSMRDYFAAAALATGELFDARDLGPIADHDKFRIEARRIADAAYGLADAMLKARKP